MGEERARAIPRCPEGEERLDVGRARRDEPRLGCIDIIEA